MGETASPKPALKRVTIYSDGACQGNPGPGGWGALLIYGRVRKELSGACAACTNNQMELTAAIEALRALKEPCHVEFYTDSEYVRQGMSSWLANWKRRGWRTQGKKPVKNIELWQALDHEAGRHEVSWHWVRGHNAQPENERCDELATLAIERLREEMSPAELSQALRAFREQPAPLYDAGATD